MAGQRAADLTRQLLAFSRRQMLDARVLDLNEVISALRPPWIIFGRAGSPFVAPGARPGPGARRSAPDGAGAGEPRLNARDAMPLGGDLTISTANVALAPGRHAEQLQVPAGDYVTISYRIRASA